MCHGTHEPWRIIQPQQTTASYYVAGRGRRASRRGREEVKCQEWRQPERAALESRPRSWCMQPDIYIAPFRGRSKEMQRQSRLIMPDPAHKCHHPNVYTRLQRSSNLVSADDQLRLALLTDTRNDGRCSFSSSRVRLPCEGFFHVWLWHSLRSLALTYFMQGGMTSPAYRETRCGFQRASFKAVSVIL